tara:strand:- start:1268 stop:1900 length:633 start_codon:yes stop_codon:yes gene_type:complete
MIPLVINLQPNRKLLFGSSAAEADLAQLIKMIQGASRPETLVNFDFSEVEAVNGSYLRATLFWAIRCGQADARNELPVTGGEPVPIRPYPLFPVVSGCNPEVATEISEFIVPRKVATLLVESGTLPAIGKARIVGHIDKSLGDTLSLLAAIRGGTAKDLANASSEAITVNAWSNRLLDLYQLRIVHRERSGKFWIYRPLAKEHDVWASTL